MQLNGGSPISGLRYVLSGRVARRSLTIALVVGLLLSITNLGDVMLQEGVTGGVALKILMIFFIPFAVSSVSALLNRNGS